MPDCTSMARTALSLEWIRCESTQPQAQATEPATIVPIARGARQLVLVGDHKQLPPTIMSREAELSGLGISLFDRLVASGVEPYMLDTQACCPGRRIIAADLAAAPHLRAFVCLPAAVSHASCVGSLSCQGILQRNAKVWDTCVASQAGPRFSLACSGYPCGLCTK